MSTTLKVKGISIGDYFLILNGVQDVSDIGFYTKTYKDEKGVKRKERHVFFIIEYQNNSFVRVERERNRLPLNKHRDFSDPKTLVLYSDKTLSDVRQDVLNEIRKN